MELKCRRCGKVGHVAQADSVEPDQPGGRNCRIAIGQQQGELSPPVVALPPPAPETIDLASDAAEMRELERLQAVARQALDAVGRLEIALGHAIATNSIEVAASYLRGTGRTFARAALALVDLA